MKKLASVLFCLVVPFFSLACGGSAEDPTQAPAIEYLDENGQIQSMEESAEALRMRCCSPTVQSDCIICTKCQTCG